MSFRVGVSDFDRFHCYFRGVDLYCLLGNDVIIISARVFHKASFLLLYTNQFHCTFMNEVLESLPEVMP